jgi:hypothetical protein
MLCHPISHRNLDCFTILRSMFRTSVVRGIFGRRQARRKPRSEAKAERSSRSRFYIAVTGEGFWESWAMLSTKNGTRV